MTTLKVTLLAPGTRPAPRVREGASESDKVEFSRHDDPTLWLFAYKGICAGNGYGDGIGEDEARKLSAAFTEPLSYENVRTAGLYDDAGFCSQCELPYCFSHWDNPVDGYGHCPRGHGKSLDPHWSPEY